jgi:hypothetical protein
MDSGGDADSTEDKERTQSKRKREGKRADALDKRAARDLRRTVAMKIAVEAGDMSPSPFKWKGGKEARAARAKRWTGRRMDDGLGDDEKE